MTRKSVQCSVVLVGSPSTLAQVLTSEDNQSISDVGRRLEGVIPALNVGEGVDAFPRIEILHGLNNPLHVDLQAAGEDRFRLVFATISAAINLNIQVGSGSQAGVTQFGVAIPRSQGFTQDFFFSQSFPKTPPLDPSDVTSINVIFQNANVFPIDFALERIEMIGE